MAESMIERLKHEREATMTDRISSLPDSLLHHILSFLPTKQAVATSLLSKRWRPLWLSLSTLDFDDGSFLKNKTFDFRFVQFVDAALMFINIGIKAAIKRKVARLELFFPPFYVCLSSSIFICSTIRVLKLKGVKVNTLSSVYLPSLEVLHLESVGFSNFKCVAMLLSGCTLLEDLVLKCVIASVDPSSVNLKGLRQLVKADVPPVLIPLEAFCNVKFLCLNEGTWIPSDEIPIFHNLTHMEFTCFIYDWNWLVKWIQNCPKLQILVIHKIACGFNNCDKEERLMEPKLRCLSSHLKEFYIRQYEGSECELQLARLIMKNARFLRTITICSTNYSNANAKIEMIKRLSSCPRGSMNCRLLFN